MEDLKNAVGVLEITRDRVQHSVDAAKDGGKLIHSDVLEWLQSAAYAAEEAENLLKHGESAKNARLLKWLPNPMVHLPIGRKIKKMTQVIQGLEKSRNNIFHENPPIGIVTANTLPKKKIVTANTSAARSVDNNEDVLESRASIMVDVMKAITDDKVRVIGVYGSGGVGKSKLLEDIESRVREEKLFDMIAKANISCNPDLKTIQGEIAYALGLKIINEETARGRADLLCRRLERLGSDNKTSILIILDNLWKKLDLKEVGIPCGDDNKIRSCKLLLTSRNREVLRITMGSDREFRLNELENGEARRLFERKVGDKVHDPEFKPLIDVAVKNCGGLPLLIVSLAKRLKRGNLAEWCNVLTNIEVFDVKSIVELSYNDLKDERIRSLFLICALTSGRILTRCFLVYCMGLGLYKKFGKTVQSARDMLIRDLHSLRDSSLLLDSDDVQLRMNDIFVDEAICIASMKENALVGKKDYGFKEWSKGELRKCTMISFYYVGIDELPEKLDCPNLKMLLLFEDNPSLNISRSFFESMEKLQVLDLNGLSFISLPSSIQFLGNLKSLCLEFCHLEDVAVLGMLKGLQFLSFLDSTITRLPKEIGELTELRFLDLTGCIGLKVIEPGVLGSLVKLEELYMEDSFDQWETQDEAPRSNASLVELQNMTKLSTLYIAIPHSANLSRDLPFGKLNKHKIQIGDVWDWSSEYKESITLKLKLDSGNLLLEEWVQRCLQRTQDLHLDGLQDDECFHDLCAKGFQELKHLHIQNSHSLLYIIHSTMNGQCNAFTKLESIFLENMSNLEKMCQGCLAPESFNKLKIVKIDNCGEIKHLFPFSMMRIFLQLEEIEISRCHFIQQIVADAETDEEGDEIDDDLRVKSCNLRRLTLRNLPEMTSFCTTVNHSIIFFDRLQVSFPWLESLTLSELPKLQEIWNSRFPSDVSNLKFLKVEDCKFLLSIIPSNLLTKLRNLEAITIERCWLVRELFNLEGPIVSGDVEILLRLTQLTLSDLPSLGRIWNKNSRRMLCFRNLMILKVQNCGNLRFLFSSSMAKALGQIKEIEIASCTLLEEIMDGEEEELEEAATMDYLEFPLLTSLSLEDLPSLRTFSYGNHHIHCASLTRLRISRCPKMMTFSSFKGKQQSTTDTSLQQAFGNISSGLSMPVFFNENDLFPSLEELTLLSLCRLRRIWHSEIPKESFCKLASFTVEDCENLSHIFPSTLLERFWSLKMIEVVGCTSLEALMEHVAVNNKKNKKHLVLLGLKEVKLRQLPRLSAVVTSNTKATLGLPSMTNISLHCCDSLRYLFTDDTANTLDKLEMLDISSCGNMQEVVAVEEGEEQKLKAVKFSHLRSLKLCSLKSLISFSSGSCAYEFPSLRNFSILECTNLKAFIRRPLAPREEMMNEGAAACDERSYSLFDKKVIFPKLEELRLTGIQSREFLENEMQDESICFHNLTFVRVENCPHLRTLFTISMAKTLGQLQYLRLGGCREMEYIVARDEEKPKEAADKIVIPQLVTLYLHNMPRLRSFCNGKHISKWPSLKEFTVEDCKAVEVILGDANSRKIMGSVPIQQPLLLVEKVEFSGMESMKISRMDKMEKIWLDELASNAFSKLKTLTVEHCQKLSSIFSSGTIITRFRNLEKLIVTDCDSLEVIFYVQEFNSIETHSTSIFQLRELVLTRLPKMRHVWSGLPQVTLNFGRLRCLKAIKCQSLKSLFPISVAKSMTQLEEFGVWYCGVEEIMVEEDGEVGASARDLFFPRLTILTLVDLPELKSFYRNSHTSTWPLLKELRVRHCGKMRSFSFTGEIESWQGTTNSENQPALFSLEKVIPHLEQLTFAREDVVMMQHDIFGNLRELVVDSSSFQEIFQEDAYGLGRVTPSGGLTDMQKPLKALGNLKQLRLINPCNLRRVWKDGSMMAEIIKQIESLFISWWPSLSIVFPSPTSFQRLTDLEVVDCASLVHMGTCSAVTSLAHLTRLTLRDCGAIEDVVTDDGNGAEKISFPKMEELILDGLPRLESFSPTNCTFMFPSLVRIIVMQCPKMKIFCNGALTTPKLDKVLLSYQDDEGRWEDDLNTTVQTLSA